MWVLSARFPLEVTPPPLPVPYRGKVAFKASSGDGVDITSLWEPVLGSKAVVVCLTHFADLTSWELGQKLIKVWHD